MEKFGDLLNTKIPVLMCFYADWNVLSIDMMPVLREVAIVVGDDVKVLKLDVDKNRELAKALKIGNLPTIIVYKNKQQVYKWEGPVELQQILDKLEIILN